jgi:hypothetical protein
LVAATTSSVLGISTPAWLMLPYGRQKLDISGTCWFVELASLGPGSAAL